jgi:prepilin-type processing-associated H-X9-DG protein
LWVVRARQLEVRVKCQKNVRELALNLINVQDAEGHFPAGTVYNGSLPPDSRLSWYVGAWSIVGDGQEVVHLNRAAAWDADENREPRISVALDSEPVKRVMGEWTAWLCPANANRAQPGWPGLTHYVGIAGVGEEAAALPRTDPAAGVFGYDPSLPPAHDRPSSGIRLSDIKDGTSTTLLVAETATDNGAWTAGGRPTVRGFDPSRLPYLGPGAQFGGSHPGGGMAGFADGSARFLADRLDPQVFAALATIAGGEAVGRISDE